MFGMRVEALLAPAVTIQQDALAASTADRGGGSDSCNGSRSRAMCWRTAWGRERYVVEHKAASEGRPPPRASALAGHRASLGLCPGIPRIRSARRRRGADDLSRR
jgi:hypothetical protein